MCIYLNVVIESISCDILCNGVLVITCCMQVAWAASKNYVLASSLFARIANKIDIIHLNLLSVNIFVEMSTAVL